MICLVLSEWLARVLMEQAGHFLPYPAILQPAELVEKKTWGA